MDEIQNDEGDWRFVECAENGLLALRAGSFQMARSHCHTAVEVSAGFACGDPRHAAALNNQAVAEHLSGEYEKACGRYRTAGRVWQETDSWISRMQPNSPAASSVFHMRMESKHRHSLAGFALAEYRSRLQIGLAITLNNRAEVLESMGSASRSFYLQALEHCDAAQDFAGQTVALIRRNSCQSIVNKRDTDQTLAWQRAAWAPTVSQPFHELAERERWIVDRPPEFTDEGRLMAALMFAYAIERCAS